MVTSGRTANWSTKEWRGRSSAQRGSVLLEWVLGLRDGKRETGNAAKMVTSFRRACAMFRLGFGLEQPLGCGEDPPRLRYIKVSHHGATAKN